MRAEFLLLEMRFSNTESRKDIMNAVMLAWNYKYETSGFFNTEKQIQTCVLMYIETRVYRTYTHIGMYVYMNSVYIYLLTLLEGLEEVIPTS